MMKILIISAIISMSLYASDSTQSLTDASVFIFYSQKFSPRTPYFIDQGTGRLFMLPLLPCLPKDHVNAEQVLDSARDLMAMYHSIVQQQPQVAYIGSRKRVSK